MNAKPTDHEAHIGRTWTPGMMSSVRQDWATPWRLVEMLKKEFRFSLDACADDSNTVCVHHFTEQDNALAQHWDTFEGGAIWVNPPYGRAIGKWVEKAFRESRRQSAPVVCLLPARTDTQWWHDYCMKGEIRFLRGRLNFDDTRRARAPFPSAIVIFRNEATGLVTKEATA